jgi:FkbH-like protein
VADALERPDMILKTNQVYPVIANWRAKSEAVGAILSTWNVGADSVIFLDDSPMELAEVAAQHPAIHGVLFPKNDPQAVLDLLRRLRDLFGKRSLTSDDGLRLESIRTGSVARVAAVSGVDGGEEFLAHAEAIVTADFHKNVLNTRAFELLNKTNQFNLNGRRLTDTDWRSLLQDNDSFVLALSYQDKYGPLGTIAVVAGQVVDSGLVIRHWVMSCRAFARRIEHQTLRILFEKFDATQVFLDFHQTERNGPTREFLCEFFDEEMGPAPLALSRRRFDERCRPMYHTVHEPASRQ